MPALTRYCTAMVLERRYKIGEAAQLLGIKPFVLRYWETEFPQLVPARTASGQRYYTDSHLTLVRRIKDLLYERGLTIEGARREMAAAEPAPGAGLLSEIRRELLTIKRLLESS